MVRHRLWLRASGLPEELMNLNREGFMFVLSAIVSEAVKQALISSKAI